MLSKREVELQELILSLNTRIGRALAKDQFDAMMTRTPLREVKWRTATIEESLGIQANALLDATPMTTVRKGLPKLAWRLIGETPERMEARLLRAIEALRIEIKSLKVSHRQMVRRLGGRIGYQKSQATKLRRRLSAFEGKSTGRSGAST